MKQRFLIKKIFQNTKTYSKPWQTSKKRAYCEIVNIDHFAKRSIVSTWQGSENAYDEIQNNNENDSGVVRLKKQIMSKLLMLVCT